MLFTLYKIDVADNVINKELVNGYSMNIMLKAETDIVHPIITLQTIDNVNFNDYNYCHIPELKRYYFIHNAYQINNKIWRLQCGCDVLESYKADILASNARVRRNIRNGDYFNASLDASVVSSVSLHNSNKGLIGGDNSIILTTVGV